MQFLVETGEGLPDSTAYASVAYVDQYVSFYHPDYTAWSSKSKAEKELAIIFATRFVDRSISFTGSILKSDQALAWPRTAFKDSEGRPVEEGTIPQLLQDTVAALALESLTSSIEDEGVLITSQKYGSSSETYAGPVRDGGNAIVLRMFKDLKRLGYAKSSSVITIHRS